MRMRVCAIVSAQPEISENRAKLRVAIRLYPLHQSQPRFFG